MSKDYTPVELQDTEMDDANGGWIIIDSMSAPVRAKKGLIARGQTGSDFLEGGSGTDT